MSLFLTWKTATIAINGTTSSEVDLENNCDFMQIIIPTITSGTVSIQVSDVTGGTFVALGNSQTTVAGTGAYATTFKLGGYQYIKVVTGAAQGAARTFSVRGEKI